MCMSSGREPIASPPGSATRARPVRASSGPSTQIEPRILRTSSYGASWFGHLRDGDRHPVGAAVGGHLDAAAEPLQQLVHDQHVGDGRQVRQRRLARGQQCGRHQLQHAVLGADDLDGPGQARAPGHSQYLHRPRLTVARR